MAKSAAERQKAYREQQKAKKLEFLQKEIHYWTDSPSSQQRNMFIFYTIASHEEKCGIKAQWHYIEAGHGKGPWDESVRQGKAIIQDANEFYRWAITS